MRLDGPESENVEDRRREGGGGFRFPGRGFPPMGGGGGRPRFVVGGGLGTIAIILIALFLGIDPSMFLGGGSQQQAYVPQQQFQEPAQRQGGQPSGQSDAARRFIAQVLGETERVWTAEFQRSGRTYEKPVLVLFSGSTRSGCGYAQAQTGPFYCPADHRIYIDLNFMDQLLRRLGAGGDFAAAYVLAHEVGHHVQNLLGVIPRVDAMRARMSETEANRVGVRLELQADCLAGIWANRIRQRVLEPGDIEEGLQAASAVGDDHIQRQQQGYVQPESFTHGSSAQRVGWFRRGLEQGNVAACDTFATQNP